ncbi:MAG: YidC/Oxa1 family membrane protein insertase [Patescibacteria group bacterium]|nr:YidC/Oxa1 family membrane protein insertase [Patescibacteria group bacterium]
MDFLNTGILGFIYWLNGFFNDFGLTIIFFTFILKIILTPIDFLAFVEELKLQKLRPKIQEIMKTARNDIQKQAELLAEVYKKENYNPFFTIFIQFLPLPILISIFFTLNKIAGDKSLSLISFGGINLAEKNFLISSLVAIVQLLMILNLPEDQRKMAFFLFGLIIVILYQFSALLNLYWLVNLILTLGERIIFKKIHQKTFILKSN